MNQLQMLGVCGLQDALAKKTVSVSEAVSAYCAAIREQDQDIRAYLTVCDPVLPDKSLCDHPLYGIPYALKDNLCTRGVRTTCASRMLESFIPPFDAAVAKRLSGGVLLGKTNLDEFGMGASTENSAFHLTRNPLHPDRVPGGSSGGSAAAVAAGLCAFALGTDTGGSIRQPAAFCGVVGMRPTYGRVSRYGMVAFASSLDQIGPLTRNVRDNAAVLQTIAGLDPMDATSSDKPVPDYAATLEQGVRGLRIAIPTDWLEGCAPAVRQTVLAAANALEQLGAQVFQTRLPVGDSALPAYYVLSSAECSSNLARYDGVKYGLRMEGDTPETMFRRSRTAGFGAEVKRRILLGTFVLSAGYYNAYYRRARSAQAAVAHTLEDAFRVCDVILSPTAPTTAYRFGEKADPISMYLGDVYTVPASLAGLPALTLPFGTDGDGLPVGVQLMGARWSEGMLYRAGYALEQASAFRLEGRV